MVQVKMWMSDQSAHQTMAFNLLEIRTCLSFIIVNQDSIVWALEGWGLNNWSHCSRKHNCYDLLKLEAKCHCMLYQHIVCAFEWQAKIHFRFLLWSKTVHVLFTISIFVSTLLHPLNSACFKNTSRCWFLYWISVSNWILSSRLKGWQESRTPCVCSNHCIKVS